MNDFTRMLFGLFNDIPTLLICVWERYRILLPNLENVLFELLTWTIYRSLVLSKTAKLLEDVSPHWSRATCMMCMECWIVVASEALLVFDKSITWTAGKVKATWFWNSQEIQVVTYFSYRLYLLQLKCRVKETDVNSSGNRGACLANVGMLQAYLDSCRYPPCLFQQAACAWRKKKQMFR